MLTMTLPAPEEKRPIRRDIFAFAPIIEPALKHDPRLLALYRQLQQGWSLYAVAKRWKVKHVTSLYRDWQRALVIIRGVLILELNEAAYEDGARVELKAWRQTIGVMVKESGIWKFYEDDTVIDAIYRMEGDALEAPEK